MKFVPKPLPRTADISKGKRDPLRVLKSVLGLLLFIALLYLGLGLLAKGLALVIPDQWEQKLRPPIVSAEGNDSLERSQAILDKLVAGESLRDLDYALFVINQPEANAVAVPGGGIGLTPPLLRTIKNEKGLAFVLAHELGHHQHRDILEGLGRQLLVALAGSLLFNYDGLSPFNSAMDAAEKGFSRNQERKADEFALRLVFKKYGSLEGALEFFEKIRQEGPEAAWEKYFSTHPITEERIRYLDELGKRLSRMALR